MFSRHKQGHGFSNNKSNSHELLLCILGLLKGLLEEFIKRYDFAVDFNGHFVVVRIHEDLDFAHGPLHAAPIVIHIVAFFVEFDPVINTSLLDSTTSWICLSASLRLISSVLVSRPYPAADAIVSLSRPFSSRRACVMKYLSNL